MQRFDCIRRSITILLALLVFSSPAFAGNAAPADTWTFSLKPYLWLPGVSGTLNYEIPPGSGTRPEVDRGSYILKKLSFAGMLSGEACKGDWAVAVDIIYLDVN
jgi:hypothetical protein